MNQQQKRQVFSGLAIIVLGLALWLLVTYEELGSVSIYLFMISGAFFAAYFYRRDEGLLIPAGVVGGCALGSLEALRLMLGIGCGFLTITVVALLYQRKFISWPLIPGTVLVLIGMRELEILEYLLNNWPLLLIALGVLIVIVALFQRDSGEG